MFEWDDDKYQRNLINHGLNFEDAGRVLAGPCVTFEDVRVDYGERRFITLGQLDGRVVIIAHTPRGVKTRIISMRKANARERQAYTERLETS